MNKKRAVYLWEHCKESRIRVNQAVKDGKLIPRLDSMENIYKILEELLDHIKQDIEVREAPEL